MQIGARTCTCLAAYISSSTLRIPPPRQAITDRTKKGDLRPHTSVSKSRAFGRCNSACRQNAPKGARFYSVTIDAIKRPSAPHSASFSEVGRGF